MSVYSVIESAKATLTANGKGVYVVPDIPDDVMNNAIRGITEGSVTELSLVSVRDISGTYTVPSYQRGYRWGETQVGQLLDDIYGFDGSEGRIYCLQPVVLKRNDADGTYELIDGQQRFTTLYLLFAYLKPYLGAANPDFSLRYQTRDTSGELLTSPEKLVDGGATAASTMDGWYIRKACQTIVKWFRTHEGAEKEIVGKLPSVKIIRYEVAPSEDVRDAFIRLNRGKIPLTNAELVKALLLARHRHSRLTELARQRIALQWDWVEQGLHDDAFWRFLVNDRDTSDTAYQTRIDLLLELISERTVRKDRYAPFYWALEECGIEGADGLPPEQRIWEDIMTAYQTLRDAYDDRDLYHWIGYLIAAVKQPLRRIYGAMRTMEKDLLSRWLKKSITESLPENPAELRYDRGQADMDRLRDILLLFNVETCRRSEGDGRRFSFDQYKTTKSYSLEHIHAQHSEGLSKSEDWKAWLKLHEKSVERVNPALAAEVRQAIDTIGKLGGPEFVDLAGRVTKALEDPNDPPPEAQMHSIANLALLSCGINAALSNAVFSVKREMILKMIGEGEYIPECTVRAFLKYYSGQEVGNVLYWGTADCKSYVRAIENTLKEYKVEGLWEGLSGDNEERNHE